MIIKLILFSFEHGSKFLKLLFNLLFFHFTIIVIFRKCFMIFKYVFKFDIQKLNIFS